MRNSFKDLTDREYAEMVWGDKQKGMAFLGLNGSRVYFIKKKKWFVERIKQVSKEEFINH